MAPLSADPSSDLNRNKIPSLHEEMDQIKAFLAEHAALAVVLIDTSRIVKIENDYGKRIYANIFDELTQLVIQMKGTVIRVEDIVTINYAEGKDQFLIFLSKKRRGVMLHTDELEVMADRIHNHINFELLPTVCPYLKAVPRIQIGYAQVIHNALIKEERLIYAVIDDAKAMADHRAFRRRARSKEALQELIIAGSVTTIFQPIVRLGDRSVIGYEALSRGPEHTPYENPFILFDAARDVGLAFELDRVCRTKALTNARHLKPDLALFINCLPTAVHDPDFKGDRLSALLDGLKLSPMRIVLEISEHDAIENFKVFRDAMRYYSDIGFAIAMDDAGSGYSSLEAVVELRPNFLKLDISLIQGIHANPLKQELVRGLATLAGRMQAQVVAEGIETDEDLAALAALGVPLGQGYLIAKPGSAFSDFEPVEIHDP